MLLQKPLQILIAVLIVLIKAQNLESLLFGHEAAFDSEAFLSDMLAALISEFLGVSLDSLL
jgi:Mrp family chromosome partitioning ATPase